MQEINPHANFLALRERLAANVLGQQGLVDALLIGLLANGHLLVEGLPGLAKTRAVKALANELEGSLARVQFTPDLLPSDITGAEIYTQKASGGEFHFAPGPLFANLVLADEINRAPAKVQAALLEAMEERQVTVAGHTHPLPEVFLVMATQNPIEQEGTYPLPEAQMDRFLMHVKVGYPSAADELNILRLVRAETQRTKVGAHGTAHTTLADVLAAREAVHAVHASPAIDQYMVDLVQATRTPARYSAELANWIEVGASPRGTLALDRCARAHAWLAGRDFITPDDVRAIAHNALRHRLILSYEASAAGVDADRVISELLRHVTAL
ncbi:AAA family ATPase [Candidatus Skiveiella danica]|uniref:AAA family ATPase n=1 Tax=Candidatus Skiveiella danica TaxID=3386177 RepID=UPI001DDD2ED1|nr:MoxR family ATPase [Betaproteobacteria bacterium]